MKRLVYQVYVGPRSKLYDFCTDSVADYCERLKFDHIVQTEPILRIQPDPETSGRSMEASKLGYLPIFEKENALAHLKGDGLPGDYDQVAVIDADVWIRSGAPSVFTELPRAWDFAGAVERDMPLTDRYRHKIRGYSRNLFYPLDDVDWNWNHDGAEFMNMGVMVLDRRLSRFLVGATPREFLAAVSFKRFVDGVGHLKWSTDQVLLNWWLRKCGDVLPVAGRVKVHHLDWRFNALYKGIKDEKVAEAHFVHFFLRDHLPNKGEDIEQLVSTWTN